MYGLRKNVRVVYFIQFNRITVIISNLSKRRKYVIIEITTLYNNNGNPGCVSAINSHRSNRNQFNIVGQSVFIQPLI